MLCQIGDREDAHGPNMAGVVFDNDQPMNVLLIEQLHRLALIVVSIETLITGLLMKCSAFMPRQCFI